MTPERERSRGRSRQKRKEKSPASRPMASKSVPAPKVAKYVEAPAFPSRPPPVAPTQGLDVQYFGRKSRRMRAILEKENWAGVGDPYTWVKTECLLYLQVVLWHKVATKDSKHVDRVVCECGSVCRGLPRTSCAGFMHFCARRCSETCVLKFWMARRCSDMHILLLLDEPFRRIRWADCTKLWRNANFLSKLSEASHETILLEASVL